MENTFKLTKQGLENLKLELEKLKTVDRPANLESLKEARAQGDLSENADYDSARTEQGNIESRIKELENILKHVEIIKLDKSRRANIGKKVVLKIGDRPEHEYTIVGPIEANPLKSKISNESPIGQAVIGHIKGDKIVVKSETGAEIKVTIVNVK